MHRCLPAVVTNTHAVCSAPALWEAERLRRGSMGGAGGAASCALPRLKPRPAKTLRPPHSGSSTEGFRGRTSGCAQALHLRT